MCDRFQGVGVTPSELLAPGTVVMVPVGQASAIVNGGPCIIAWATVNGPDGDDWTTPEGGVKPDSRWWLDVRQGPVVQPQMYRADEILGVPALGLSMAGTS
jgi:hypothetical protein